MNREQLKNIIGQRIVDIQFKDMDCDDPNLVLGLKAIVLENGVRLFGTVIECDYDYEIKLGSTEPRKNIKMKKITVKSNFHNTMATFYAPESIEYTGDAMHWLWKEGEAERDKSGRYGPARKRYLETRRKLCTDSACNCGVKSEKC